MGHYYLWPECFSEVTMSKRQEAQAKSLLGPPWQLWRWKITLPVFGRKLTVSTQIHNHTHTHTNAYQTHIVLVFRMDPSVDRMCMQRWVNPRAKTEISHPASVPPWVGNFLSLPTPCCPRPHLLHFCRGSQRQSRCFLIQEFHEFEDLFFFKHVLYPRAHYALTTLPPCGVYPVSPLLLLEETETPRPGEQRPQTTESIRGQVGSRVRGLRETVNKVQGPAGESQR